LVLGLAGLAAAVLLAGGGFVAGSHYRGDHTALVSGPGVGRHVPGGGQGPFGDRGPDGRGFPGGPAMNGMPVVVGQVTAINGSTLTIGAPDGTSVKVTTTKTTVVGGAAGGDLSSVRVGQAVVVAGTRADDGTVTATAIMTRPGRGGFGGAGGSQ
jgi:Domain of unknown function (DUF5666)